MSTQSITLEKSDKKNRFVIFDLLRLISIFVIVPFHLSEFSFNSETHPVYAGSFLNTEIIKFAKFIPFSGHTVVLLSFFLIGWGYQSARKLLRLIGIALAGYGILSAAYFDGPLTLLYWDIYSFLIVALILSLGFLTLPYGGVLAFVLAVIASTPNIVNWNIEFLGGICLPENQSAWPLLPWGLYAASFAVLGRELRSKKSAGLLRIQNFVCRYSKVLFVLFAISSVFVLQGMTQVTPTDRMYCFIQQLSFLQKLFLVSMWSALFLYGSETSVSARWSQGWMKYLSFVSWNRNFALAYLNQIILIGLFTSYPSIFLDSPHHYDLTLVAVFLGTEILTHSMLLIFKKYSLKKITPAV